ncbi:MAG: PepSY domain-containing protein [Treponema sp.]|nr:PepSY domain-containing protein [Treponema sp.]
MKRKILMCAFVFFFFAVSVYAQTITAAQAGERAVSMVGGGTVSSLELVNQAGVGQVYRIVVINNAVRYDVTISVTGDVISLTSGHAGAIAGAVTPAQHDGIFIGTVVPRPPRRSGSPANPAISAQRAVEIARDHLVSIGVTQARFDYVYMDWERGRWVWSVEFDAPRGVSYEFYIDVSSGAIVEFQID